jgi:putative transcriptional regulator
MVNYHPSSESLAAYAAGSLPLSQALCISTHLETCSHCKAQAKRLKLLGSELFQQLNPAESTESAMDKLKDSVLSRINAKSDDTVSAAPFTQPSDTAPAAASTKIPQSLRQFITESYDELDWKRISSSLESVNLCRDSNGAKVDLIRIKAGGKVPHHRHDGEEITMVLEGSFSDEDGLYQPGDYMVRDASEKHKPVATKDGECICLTVVDGPIQFTGPLTRVLNPFIRSSFASTSA